MPISDGLAEQLKDMLQPLGPIAVRRMFGAAGVFLDGLMFALVDDDVVYLKTDDQNVPQFRAEGLEAYTYATKLGQKTLMSYRRAPERLLDDADELLEWAGKAVAAARRKPAASAKRKPRAAPDRLPPIRTKPLTTQTKT